MHDVSLRASDASAHRYLTPQECGGSLAPTSARRVRHTRLTAAADIPDGTMYPALGVTTVGEDMVTLIAAAAMALPPADATWELLQDKPVPIVCTEHGGSTWCKSEGILAAKLDAVASSLRDMRLNADKFEAIVKIDVLSDDALRVVLDFPSLLSDRDYVAKYSLAEEDGGVKVLSWTSTTHPDAPPEAGIVRLPNFAGEWRLVPEGESTRVTYLWHADIAGSFPSWALPIARKKAGYEALKDLAKVNGATLTAP